MHPVVEYQYLLPYQFAERIEHCPLAYVPVGSLEWHGEHLALGNDAIKMHALCCAAARRGGGIVFPPIYYGIPYMVHYGAEYGHTCREQRDLMREIAGEYQGAMRVYGTDDMEWAADLDFTSDHAAKWETSILWYLRPELVGIHKLPRDTAVALEGVGGDDPRLYASRDLGRAAVEAIARDLSSLGARLLSEVDGR